jgi:hypothetical protein
MTPVRRNYAIAAKATVKSTDPSSMRAAKSAGVETATTMEATAATMRRLCGRRRR